MTPKNKNFCLIIQFLINNIHPDVWILVVCLLKCHKRYEYKHFYSKFKLFPKSKWARAKLKIRSVTLPKTTASPDKRIVVFFVRDRQEKCKDWRFLKMNFNDVDFPWSAVYLWRFHLNCDFIRAQTTKKMNLWPLFLKRK